MNFALSHVLGSTLQTALLNSSLVVLVGWGMDKSMVSIWRNNELRSMANKVFQRI